MGCKKTNIIGKLWCCLFRYFIQYDKYILLATDVNSGELVAIKEERAKQNDGSQEEEEDDDDTTFEREADNLQLLQGVKNIPKLIFEGKTINRRFIVQEFLGNDLSCYVAKYQKFSFTTALQIIEQLIPTLEQLHNRCLLHRDLKPENILTGVGLQQDTIYLIDFGISKIYCDSNGKHISFKQNKSFVGTSRYASIAAHKGYEQGRKDDLESLCYVMLYLLKGKLPWQDIQQLCGNLPAPFLVYLNYCKNLGFNSKPDYSYLQNLFKTYGEQVLGIDYNKISFEWLNSEYYKLKQQQHKHNLQHSKNINNQQYNQKSTKQSQQTSSNNQTILDYLEEHKDANNKLQSKQNQKSIVQKKQSEDNNSDNEQYNSQHEIDLQKSPKSHGQQINRRMSSQSSSLLEQEEDKRNNLTVNQSQLTFNSQLKSIESSLQNVYDNSEQTDQVQELENSKISETQIKSQNKHKIQIQLSHSLIKEEHEEQSQNNQIISNKNNSINSLNINEFEVDVTITEEETGFIFNLSHKLQQLKKNEMLIRKKISSSRVLNITKNNKI